VKLQAALNALAVIAALYAFEFYLSYRFLNVAVLQEADQDQVPASAAHLGWTPARINPALGVERSEDAVLGHFPHARVRLCSGDYGPVVIETDRNGLNNPDAIYEDRIDVAIVGDSFLHGFCQPLGSDVGNGMRSHGVRVLNAAPTGSGPLKHYAFIGRYVRPLRPPKVIMCFFEGNDLEDLGRELREPQSAWLGEALADEPVFGPSARVAANLARASAEEDELAAAYGRQLRRGVSSLFTNPVLIRNFLALHTTTSALGLFYGQPPANLDPCEAVLRRTRDLVASWSATLDLCYIPSKYRFAGVLPAHVAFDATRDRITALARDLGIGLVDLTPAFAAHPDPAQLYASDGHFSIEGAAVAASVLAAGAGPPGSQAAY
jgi:hypothetical protein